jgi:two-component system sensor histidine kinase MprB
MTPASTDGRREPWPADAQARLLQLVHDLRTPLTIVTGFTDLLERRDDLSPERREEFVARIAQAARELAEILDSERADRLG